MSPLVPFEVSRALEGEMDKGCVREFCHHYQHPPRLKYEKTKGKKTKRQKDKKTKRQKDKKTKSTWTKGV